MGHERVQPAGEGVEEESTSGVSTVNSVKSQKIVDSIENKYWREYRDQMGVMKIENMRLLQELLECQKTYQTMLHQALEEQKAQIGTLTQLCESMNRRFQRQESGWEKFLQLSKISFLRNISFFSFWSKQKKSVCQTERTMYHRDVIEKDLCMNQRGFEVCKRPPVRKVLGKKLWDFVQNKFSLLVPRISFGTKLFSVAFSDVCELF